MESHGGLGPAGDPLDISRIKIQNSIVGDNVTGLHSILFDETRN